MDNRCPNILRNFVIYVFPVISIILSIMTFVNFPYNDEYYNEYINTLKLTPISSISINYDIMNKKIKEKNILNLERLDSEYNYEYLILNNNKYNHPCGYDKKRNFLFLPNDIECPINYIKISNSQYPDDIKFNYKTIKIADDLFLHYSKNNIYGYIYNNISFYLDSSSSDYMLDTNIYNYNFTFVNNTEFGILQFKNIFNLKEKTIIIYVLTLILLLLWIPCFRLAYKNRNIPVLIYFIILIVMCLGIYYFYVLYSRYSLSRAHMGDFTLSISSLSFTSYFSIFIIFLLAFFCVHMILLCPASYYLMLINLFDFGNLFEINKRIKKAEDQLKEIEEKKSTILGKIEDKKFELEPLINKENQLDSKIEEIIKNIKEKQSEDIKNLREEIKKREEDINNYKMYVFQQNIYKKN